VQRDIVVGGAKPVDAGEVDDAHLAAGSNRNARQVRAIIGELAQQAGECAIGRLAIGEPDPRVRQAAPRGAGFDAEARLLLLRAKRATGPSR
jgi:hypothetical protein